MDNNPTSAHYIAIAFAFASPNSVDKVDNSKIKYTPRRTGSGGVSFWLENSRNSPYWGFMEWRTPSHRY